MRGFAVSRVIAEKGAIRIPLLDIYCLTIEGAEIVPFFVVLPRQNLLLPILQSVNREVSLGLLHRADKPERRHCYDIALGSSSMGGRSSKG